jgi:hypothetical protein
LFTQRPKQKLDDFSKWVKMTRPVEGSDFYRMNGVGEIPAGRTLTVFPTRRKQAKQLRPEEGRRKARRPIFTAGERSRRS